MITPLNISIITPSFNQDKYLEQTIISVLAQDYLNYEYLVIDGGSDDDSTNILKKYNSKISYWISEIDMGQTDAINKGLRKSSCEILNWLNSDDCFLPGAFEKIFNAFNDHPEADFIYGDIELIDESGASLGRILYPQANLNILIYGGNLCAQPACFFRRRVIEKIGYLNQELDWSMDYEFWLRAANEKMVFYHMPEVLAQFRLHSGSKSVSQHNLITQQFFESYWAHFGADRPATNMDKLQYKLKKMFFRFYRLLLLAITRKSFQPFSYKRALKKIST